ncbi:substance-K receptor-like [Paramacrobiotus metropolitanus]|uniref:substance-K receptor-like n=1 Tax=Paramacrobiotus metropolitanus TaxID=2943436 RepID=UPI002445EAA4|nr:substance-K receptor-like [Paramacrobiotus metropolitanus]
MCTFRNYTGWVFSGIPMHMHVLITVNRIWAVCFPHSYRTRHSTVTAICLVIAAAFYVHIICLPGVILDALYYRVPAETSGCNVDTTMTGQKVWEQLTMILIYDVPVVFMISAYAVLCFKEFHRREAVAGLVYSVVTLGTLGIKIKKKKAKRTGFLVLTALTISVAVCWTPYEMYFTVGTFMDIDVPMMREVGFTLNSLQPLLDPILFVITMSDLRKTLLHCLHFAQVH